MGRTLPSSFQQVSYSMGRSQQNNNKFFNANRIKKEGYIPLNERTSTEWDLRLDLTNGLTATAVVERARSFKDAFSYCLISGLEFGKSRADRPTPKGWLTEEEEIHVHIALITTNVVNRLEALAFFRPTKTGGEYAVPRKTQHTYIGWRLHHTKVATKTGSANPIWEYGTLPMDPFNGETGLQIYYMVRNYGNEDDKQTYKGYLDLGLAKKSEDAKKRKRKANDEVEELRKRIKELEDKQ